MLKSRPKSKLRAMKTRAVIDTNILVSGFISPLNPPGRIFDAVLEKACLLVADDRILDEYQRVFLRPKFDAYVSRRKRAELVQRLHRLAFLTISTEAIPHLPDPKDACFLEVARTAGVPLVTGNLAHFPEDLRAGVEVLTAKDFIVRHGF